MTELTDHFDVGELRFFPVAISQDKTKGKVGANIDARAVEDRLDAVVSSYNWQTAYRVLDTETKAVECTLSLYTEGGWVAKSDVGYPNEARDAGNASREPLKAAYSDALKRAAVQWGIGRYIYSLELERDWLPVDEYGRFTQEPKIRADVSWTRPSNITAADNPRATATPKVNASVGIATSDGKVNWTAFWKQANERGYTRERVTELAHGRVLASMTVSELESLLGLAGDEKIEPSEVPFD